MPSKRHLNRAGSSIVDRFRKPAGDLMNSGDQLGMATRAPFLKTRYGGYHHRYVPREDAELTHVGPDTPCGEYMRRFWQPVCYSDELKDLPLKLRILGED